MRIRLVLSVLPCLALIAVPIDGDAAVYTVGSDAAGSCTHANIQAALDAAASTPEADEVRVSSASEHSGPLRVHGGDLVLAGGYADCTAATPTGRSVVRGSIGKIMPVLAIDTGACADAPPPLIDIEGLDITQGPDHGLYVSGCVDLQLSRMRIHGNSAPYGAGVAVSGLGATTRVVIGDDVRIEDNTAMQAGGGLYVFAASLNIGGSGTLVRDNRVSAAEGFAGGIALFGAEAPLQTTATITSGGHGDDGVVARNTAARAAGLWAAGNTLVEAYTTDATRPVRFNGNAASAWGSGGAIRLEGAGARMLVVEGVLDANTAGQGAAVSLAEGANFIMQSLPVSHPADAVGCAAGVACNRVVENAVPDGRRGAILAADGGPAGVTTRAGFSSIRMSGNRGDSLFAETCTGPACAPLRIDVTNSLVAGNAMHHVLHAPGVATFTCDLCTLAGSPASSEPLFRTAGSLALARSVVWEPGRPLVGGLVPAHLDGIALQLHERSAFPADEFPTANDIEVGDPRFVSPADGDYHPASDSPLLDRAWNNEMVPLDIDGCERAVDQPGVPDVAGPVDLGAFERGPDGVSSDSVFADGFESALMRD